MLYGQADNKDFTYYYYRSFEEVHMEYNSYTLFDHKNNTPFPYRKADDIMSLEKYQEDTNMSFVCMYKNNTTISAATDGFETKQNLDGTRYIVSDHACKLIQDSKKRILIAFCGVLEYKGIRTENRIRSALHLHEDGQRIEELFSAIERNLEFSEGCIGTTNVMIGYFDFVPQIGFMEIKRTTDGIIRQVSYHIDANAVGAGTDPYFMNGLSQFTYADTKLQAINTVTQAIALDQRL